MTDDHFKATFSLSTDRATVWRCLTERHLDDESRVWLPGFDSAVTVTEREELERLQATKGDEPCAGTEIVVTLTDAETGTTITVVQSRFGDWMPAQYDVMNVGWHHIVADLQTYLATGVHARRHLRAWADLGANAVAVDGGMRVGSIRPETLADRLGLVDDDLLVVLSGAPICTHDDLFTALRVLDATAGNCEAEWVRGGELHRATVSAVG